MKKAFRLFPVLCSAFLFFQSCGSGGNEKEVIADSASIASGEAAFNQNCSSCHNFVQDGIGPQLSGVTSTVPAEWISNFIHDPKKSIDAGDERSKKLFDKYHTVMPSFAVLGDEKISDIIAYLKTVKVKAIAEDDGDTNFIKDPIPEKIKMSGLALNLEEVAQMPLASEKKPATRLIKIGNRPGSDNLFVLDLRGNLYMLNNGKPEMYMDMKLLRKDFIDQPGLATGFGSFAFHPDFQKNGLLYTSHCEPKGTAKADFSYNDSIPVQLQWVVTEWKTDPKAFPFKGDGRELFRINFVSGIHGMQEITFNPTATPGSKDYGKLYIALGDGGCVENKFPFLAHTPAKPWGSILRIDPSGHNSANGHYGIPADNPFAKDTGKVKEMYAYGFRNPHRISWTHDGKMLAINIGQANIEALYMIQPGRDYGWPLREGNFLITPDGNINKARALPTNDKTFNIIYPVAEYDHDEGRAISGGHEYYGSAIKELTGKYVFGDLNNGRLFFVETKNLGAGKPAVIKEFGVVFNGQPTDIQKLCGDTKADMRVGIDHNGTLYVFTKPNGKIYRVTGVTKQN